jgi:hypothetical protein
MFLTAIIFVFVARHYRGRTYFQGEDTAEASATAFPA